MRDLPDNASLDHLRRQAKVAGDRIEVTLPIFTSSVTAALNWTISRANIALNGDDDAEREVAERGIRDLAAHPLSLDSLQRLAAGPG